MKKIKVEMKAFQQNVGEPQYHYYTEEFEIENESEPNFYVLFSFFLLISDLYF